MSRYTGQFGRGQPFSSNTFSRQQYANFESQDEYTYDVQEQDYAATGDNSYDQFSQDTTSYDDTWQDMHTSQDMQKEFQTGGDYGADNTAGEAYSGSSYGYEHQNPQEEYAEDNSYQYQQGSYEYGVGSYEDQNDSYSQPVSDYYNYSSGYSNVPGRGTSAATYSSRGSSSNAGQFGHLSTKPYNQSQNQFGSRGSVNSSQNRGSRGAANNSQNRGFRGSVNSLQNHGSRGSVNNSQNRGFRGSANNLKNPGFRGAANNSQNQFDSRGSAGRGRGRARGWFNQNSGKNQYQPPNPSSGYGQFDKLSASEVEEKSDTFGVKGQGQFSLPTSTDSNTANISTQSVAKKGNEGGKKGQFGQQKESETASTPSVGNSNSEQSTAVGKSNSGQSAAVGKSNSGQSTAVGKSNSEQSTAKGNSNSEQSTEKEDVAEVRMPEDTKVEEKDDEDSDSSDEDTDFCKYCKTKFATAKAYHTHTRGLQHTTLVMEAKAKKGNAHFQKEQVDASVLAEVKTPEDTKVVEEEDDEDSDSSDEDTDFCKYCKMKFTTPKAYHTHTRGLQHTTLVMEAKAKKGHAHFQKEHVDASVLEVHIPAPKPHEPEKMTVDDDFEDNWMNLDEDVIKYIKEKKNPENRDLNIYDVGKNPLPDDFNCPLCNVKCTGAGAFKMHIDGKQHRSNIEAAKQGAKIKKKKQIITGVMVETKDRPSKFSEMIVNVDYPMLGVEFVTEFQKADLKAAPRYVCNLCESKCDGSTIVPHIIGLKHRLKYMQNKKPLMYDHLTKYNTKKKKSEMNANLEDFAREIEQEVGRGDVKIKVELDDFEDEEELKESMLRHSKVLAEKVKELEEGKTPFDDEPGLSGKAKSKEPPPKKPRLATELASEWRSRRERDASNHDKGRDDRGRDDRGRDRERDDRGRDRERDDRGRDARVYDRERDDRGRDTRVYDRERDDRGRDAAVRNWRDSYSKPEPDNYRVPLYEDSRRLAYDDRRRHQYDDIRDPYGRRRYPEDFRASYRDQFDPYRVDDRMYERRIYDERRRLDGLMGERHRLDDPYAERRRVDDIVERRRCLDELETSRVNDIMERRKRIQESDPDYLRLKRFTERDLPVKNASSSPSLSEEEKKRLDDVLARRQALKAAETPATRTPAAESRDSTQTDMQAIQNKLALHVSSDPAMAAKQEQAAKDLQEEAARNPHINIAEVMTNLSSSMIATEDDAAMALQISNALTHALLKYRLENAPKELSALSKSVGPLLDKKPAETSIPGLGTSNSSSSVPSFLRTSQQSSYSSDYSALGSNTNSYTSQQNTQSVFQPALSTATSYSQSSQQGAVFQPALSTATSYSQLSQPSTVFQPALGTATSYSQLSQPSTVFQPALGTATSYSQLSQPSTVFQPALSTATSYSQLSQPSTVFQPALGTATSYSQLSQPGTVFQPAQATSYIQSSQQGTVQSSSAPALASSSQSYLHVSQQSSQPQYSYTAYTRSAGTTSYSDYSHGQPVVTAPTLVPAPSGAVNAGQDQKKKLIDTSNIDQPQKLLLESIREQTERLRHKIQAASGNSQPSTSNSSVNVLNQSKQVHGSTSTATSASPYATYASSSSVNPASVVASYVTSSSNEKAPSSYSSQYYQYNYHTTPPNSAPAPVPTVQPPLPSGSAKLPPLPTNDLPPMRRKRHR